MDEYKYINKLINLSTIKKNFLFQQKRVKKFLFRDTFFFNLGN